MGDSETTEVCLKCGQAIVTHIPYKYEGQVFHSRCLNCSTCGRNLVGKPFTIAEPNIFCGEQCQVTFEAVPTSDLNSSQASEGSTEGGNANAPVNESLIEALENIDETNRTMVKLSQEGSPMWNSDSERITDYPVSNSPDSLLSRSPAHGSRSSSLSVSESSLNSEGSMSYDAKRRPGKRILKKPHGPRRRSTNRVRWNLPNGENDSDTTSLESFDSSTTSGAIIYQRARNNMLESRRNWRDFEQSPQPGSTGLTPAKEVQARHQVHPTRPMSPLHRTNAHHLQLSPQRFPHKSASATDVTARPFPRSSSPLRHSPAPSESPSSMASYSPATFLQPPSKTRHSTPLRRYGSELGGRSGNYPLQLHRPLSPDQAQKLSTPVSQTESPGNFINVPILRIGDSSIPDLDISTPGEKQRAHMFRIPPQPHGSVNPQATQRLETYTNSLDRRRRFSAPAMYQHQHQHSSTSRMAPGFVKDDDDADDYDHLKPVEELSQSQRRPLSTKKGRQKAGSLNPNHRLSPGAYGDEDIDEALLKLSNEDGYDSDDSSLSSPITTQPPPIPPRGELSTEHVTNPSPPPANAQRASNVPTPPHIPPRSVQSLREASGPRATAASVTKQAQREDQGAPPVPPRAHSMHPRNVHDRYARYSRGKCKPLPPLPEVSPSQSPTPGGKRYANRNGSQSPEVEDILPPPPQFSGIAPRPDPPKVQSSFASSDDQLASLSDTTLVAGDQGESSSHSLLNELKIYPEKLNGLSSEIAGQAELRVQLPSLSQAGKSNGEVRSGIYSHRSHLPWNPTSLAKFHDSRQTENANRASRHPHHQQRNKLGPETRVIHLPASESDSSLDDLTTKVTQTVVHNARQVKPVSPEPTVTAESRTHLQAERVQSPEAADISKSATSPRHKVSMEHAYNEGNVLNTMTHQPQPIQSPRSRQRRSSEQVPERNAVLSQLRRTASHSQNPVVTSSVFADHFSPEDQQVLQMFYSGGKPPMMKPVFHDAERTIEEMLAELESEGSSEENHVKKRPRGPCVSCGKMIINAKTLETYEGSQYHAKCFRCSVCGCSLKGKALYRVRDRLLCREDYPKYGLTNGTQPTAFRRRDQQVHSYPSPLQEQRMHTSVHGGQVTSV